MEQLRRFAKPISHLLVLCLLSLGTYIPAARAAIIGTEAVANAQQAQQQRDHVRGLLDRNDVKAYLRARGVDPADVQARVDGLTDAEVQALASRLDKYPAGGVDALGLALIVFIVLLITDILGYTDIFPFVKKKSR